MMTGEDAGRQLIANIRWSNGHNGFIAGHATGKRRNGPAQLKPCRQGLQLLPGRAGPHEAAMGQGLSHQQLAVSAQQQIIELGVAA